MRLVAALVYKKLSLLFILFIMNALANNACVRTKTIALHACTRVSISYVKGLCGPSSLARALCLIAIHFLKPLSHTPAQSTKQLSRLPATMRRRPTKKSMQKQKDVLVYLTGRRMKSKVIWICNATKSDFLNKQHARVLYKTFDYLSCAAV